MCLSGMRSSFEESIAMKKQRCFKAWAFQDVSSWDEPSLTVLSWRPRAMNPKCSVADGYSWWIVQSSFQWSWTSWLCQAERNQFHCLWLDNLSLFLWSNHTQPILSALHNLATGRVSLETSSTFHLAPFHKGGMSSISTNPHTFSHIQTHVHLHLTQQTPNPQLILLSRTPIPTQPTHPNQT